MIRPERYNQGIIVTCDITFKQHITLLIVVSFFMQQQLFKLILLFLCLLWMSISFILLISSCSQCSFAPCNFNCLQCIRVSLLSSHFVLLGWPITCTSNHLEFFRSSFYFTLLVIICFLLCGFLFHFNRAAIVVALLRLNTICIYFHMIWLNQVWVLN